MNPIQPQAARFSLLRLFGVLFLGAALVYVLFLVSARMVMTNKKIPFDVMKLRALEYAIISYNSRCGALPLPKAGSGSHYRLNREEYQTLLDFIGTPRHRHATNKLGESFLQFVENGEYQDIWQHDFVVVFDCTGKSKVTANPVPGGGPWCDVPRPFAIWSRGADYQPGPPETGDALGKPGKSAKDEINGWE